MTHIVNVSNNLPNSVVDVLTGHFGTRTFRHQDSSAPVQNGAEVSRDTSAPSVKNTYDMGYCFVRIGLLLVPYAEICRSYN